MFVSDSNLCLHSDVMLCLYQVTEYMRFSVADAADSHWTSTTIPTALSKAFVNIASHVQQAPDSSHKVNIASTAKIDTYQHMSGIMRKPTFWFPTWSDTNQAVQSQKMARGLKFRI